VGVGHAVHLGVGLLVGVIGAPDAQDAAGHHLPLDVRHQDLVVGRQGLEFGQPLEGTEMSA